MLFVIASHTRRTSSGGSVGARVEAADQVVVDDGNLADDVTDQRFAADTGLSEFFESDRSGDNMIGTPLPMSWPAARIFFGLSRSKLWLIETAPGVQWFGTFIRNRWIPCRTQWLLSEPESGEELPNNTRCRQRNVVVTQAAC